MNLWNQSGRFGTFIVIMLIFITYKVILTITQFIIVLTSKLKIQNVDYSYTKKNWDMYTHVRVSKNVPNY